MEVMETLGCVSVRYNRGRGVVTYAVTLPYRWKVSIVLMGSRVTFNGVEVLSSNSSRLRREGKERLVKISSMK